MRGGEETDRFDAVIDRALRSYAEPGEVPETRVVLARVLSRAGESESQRKALWVWGAAVAAGLAVLAVVGMVWVMQGPRRAEIAWRPKAPVVRRSGNDAVAKAPSFSGLSARLKSCPDTKACSGGVERIRTHPLERTSIAQQDGARESLPKLDVFPMPRPLTQEEQALVALARQASPATKHQVIEAEKHLGDPIAIAELEIAPLESGEKQDSNEPENNRER